MRNRPTLVDDVVLDILCYCDMSTVLAMSLASRTFRILSTSKQVWLALLSDLHWHNLIDLLPDQRLNELSADELIELAKRTVQGPKSWASSYPSSPVVFRKVVLKRDDGHHGEWYAHLLPGGHYVLQSNNYEVRCRDTKEGKLIWADDSRIRFGLRPIEFAADVVDGGGAVRIICGLSVQAFNYIQVVHLDLSTHSSKTLINRSFNYDRRWAFQSLAIKGDFAVIRFSSPASATFVTFLQISTAYSSTFQAPPGEFDIAMLPDHIAISEVTSATSFELGFWSTLALVQHHKDEESFHPSLDTVKPVSTTTFDTFDITPTMIRLNAFLSPLRSDSSVLWVLLCPSGDKPMTLVCKYHISHCSSKLATKPTTRWTRGENLLRSGPYLSSVSSSGFAWSWLNSRDMIMRLEDKAKELELPPFSNVTHLSAYSGALTYTTREEELVISYYE